MVGERLENYRRGELLSFLKRNGIDEKRFEAYIHKTIILSVTDLILRNIHEEELESELRSKLRATPEEFESIIYRRLIKKYIPLELNEKENEEVGFYLKTFLSRNVNREMKPSLDEENKKLAEQDGKCAFCGLDIIKGDYEIDHIMPHSFFGDKEVSDFQLLCRQCNGKKFQHILSTLNLVFVPDCPKGQL